jgi:hypothetical protein
MILTHTLKGTDVHLILLGDLSDGPDSNTLSPRSAT